ncbi:AraC family transcriptional regulator [Actinoallomurus iriomotensis]|uniref:AraC family transcriptional regulator n=1 Tax=Actinoallomurus iriomotensis TaxID=478107 RepID=A0A9W6R9N7_9ACTN|nr:AraC family transcriptional regulator [Actinoallomurus iriomotensis]GLY71891.1 AraC family transcriptional regulator [Actinoallomurus iriomotensis]
MDREVAKYRQHPTEPGVDLLSARFVTHRYTRHAHATYTIGLIESGVEEFQHAGSLLRVTSGQVALLNPQVVHTGQAGVPEGWRYRVLYPAVDLVREVAAELGAPGGTPHFPATVVDDPAVARLLRSVHASAARGDALASSSALRTALASVLRRHAARPPHADDEGTAPRAVRAARDLLHARPDDPPSLDELAAAVGSRPFVLLRAFRAAYGLPPHAYLTNLRVQRARALLDAGLRPAEVATVVGFTDQAHLTRHFKRVVGVPPGAYALGRTA